MRTAGPANPRIRLVWRSRTRMAAIVKPMPATIMILPCTTSPLAQRVLISNMFMGKSEGVASGALAGPFFTLRPQRLGVFRIELCFSKVMVLSPHNKRPQKFRVHDKRTSPHKVARGGPRSTTRRFAFASTEHRRVRRISRASGVQILAKAASQPFRPALFSESTQPSDTPSPP